MFRHIIYSIFFWELVNKTADCFKNIVFILVAKISSKKVCEKMESNSTLEKILLVCNRNAVAVGRSIFWFQSGFPQKDEEEIFDNSEKFAEKYLSFFVLFVCNCWHLKCHLSIESVRTGRTQEGDSNCTTTQFAVFFNKNNMYFLLFLWLCQIKFAVSQKWQRRFHIMT